ncbi:two-component regulator propeller domain-containing protein [Stenotrophomonas sp. C3(2023)]|uniref:two-component regulator propeller domain-containing protein n=1 Tax=Stenotrophomonas sp. C3(2023) TaxID=3080277 RepID=UPI00293CEFDD|nr:two-component regulator propeller domain-containing protein [Stenotrophomonas sp. C3(2023)]MDV3468064.1 two-component regulator propeller domain-containing protein [Stenotrophomonas sp. C3(2023)]
MIGSRGEWITVAWRGLLGLLLLLAPVLACAAHGGAPPLRDYAIDVWTSRNGLPHNSLRDIAQTPEGHLWFATWEGLVRYNGLDFTVFDRSSRPPLRDNGIGSLLVDRQGALWISDSRGNISRRTLDGRWDVWDRRPEIPQVLVNAMQMDSHGRLWLLYEGKGIGYLGPDGEFSYSAPPPGLPLALSFTKLAVDAQDRVWVGTLDGMVLRDTDGVLKRAPEAWGLGRGLVWPYRAPDGVLWIVAGERLYRMDDGIPRLAHRLPGQIHMTAMLQDRHGDLWLGTENQGLLRISQHGLERLPAGLNLPGGRVVSLREDAEGSIWVGANGGLYRLRETLFSSYTERDGLSGDYVRTVLEDRDRTLWVGSASGLDRRERNGAFEPVPLHNRGGKAPSVLSLAQAGDGSIWVGTFGDGVLKLDRSGRLLHTYDTREGMPGGNIRAISIAPDGVVWAGTQKGVVRIDARGPGVPTLDGLPGGLTTALAHDPQGNLWIGTIEGIWVIRGDKVEHIDLSVLGGGRSVFGFQQIGDAMWISSDRGLYRYQDGQLARVGLEQGMPVDTVFQLVPDRLGNVWVSSNRGVLRTDMAMLNEVADGRAARISVERYNEIDGMANSQANGSSGPAALLRQDGTFWVVTAGGLSTVDPLRLQRFRERLAPPAVVESVQVDGVPIHWEGAPRTAVEGGSRLTVTFVGLSFLMSERIRYRTRLDGLDSGWVERGQQRSVEFIGLPPGDYVLHVSAAHPGGNWSDSEAVWAFTIKPLWWQKGSVRAAVVLLLLAGLVALYRYLINRYKRSNIRLAKRVDEATRDLQAQTLHLQALNAEKTALAERLAVQAEAFERQAREDALTGLANRRAFDEALARDFARSQRSGHPLCLVVLDVDHFKDVNDRHSHSIGDAVLVEVAQLLASACRDSDMPARTGGEEFALLLNDTRLAEAAQVCARLRGLFHDHQDWGGIAGLTVTFSAGLVELERNDRTPKLLYQRADRALYRAKSDGRDRTSIG